MMKKIRVLIVFVVVLSLLGCDLLNKPKDQLTIDVINETVEIVKGQQVDWTNNYTAKDNKNNDLTSLVIPSIEDTINLEIGLYEITLSLTHNDLSVSETIYLNVILTNEDIFFSVPEEKLIFQVGDDLSSYDFNVTAQTASGVDLTEHIKVTGYNLSSVLMGFHKITFSIQVSKTILKKVDVSFEVHDKDTYLEVIGNYNNVTIRNYALIDNIIYIMGFSWEDENIYNNLIAFNLDDYSIKSIKLWSGNQKGTGDQPHGSWEDFIIYNDYIYLIGSEAYLTDETKSGTDKFEYHTMLYIYDLNLKEISKTELFGLNIDIPTKIAINDEGLIAVTGYKHNNYDRHPVGIYNTNYELVFTEFYGSIKNMIAEGNSFIAAGYYSGDYSKDFNGFVNKFNIDGLIWEYIEKGFDMDIFQFILKTDQNFTIFGETNSYISNNGTPTIAFNVVLDSDGNFIERNYYYEARFPYKSFIINNNKTHIVSFDVVSYPDYYSNNELVKHRIPAIYIYNEDNELINMYSIYLEKYISLENSIIIEYKNNIYAFVSVGLILPIEESNVDSALYFIKINNTQK